MFKLKTSETPPFLNHAGKNSKLFQLYPPDPADFLYFFGYTPMVLYFMKHRFHLLKGADIIKADFL